MRRLFFVGAANAKKTLYCCPVLHTSTAAKLSAALFNSSSHVQRRGCLGGLVLATQMVSSGGGVKWGLVSMYCWMHCI